MAPPLALLEQRLGHRFADHTLLQRALTHRSFSADHNERLEFLGDAVLSLTMSHLLYQRLQQAPEGDLSRIRANLVKQDSLHQVALQLDLSAALRLGEGELRSGGLTRASILADAFEAVLGAVFLDAGFAVAEQLVQRFFADVDISAHAPAGGKDAKTALQEWLQARKHPVPQYQVVHVGGQAHQQVFHVTCTVAALGLDQQGSGTSRRAAEQDAAAKVLALVEQQPPGKKAGRSTRKLPASAMAPADAPAKLRKPVATPKAATAAAPVQPPTTPAKPKATAARKPSARKPRAGKDNTAQEKPPATIKK